MRPILAVGLALFIFGCQEEPPTEAEFRAMAAKGLTAEVRRAAALGVKLDSTDENGHSALSMAAFNGHDDTVRELLKLGANPESGSSTGRALVLACGQNRIEIVTMLLEQGAKPQYGQKEDQPLAATTDPRIIELLIQAGADPRRASGSLDNTPLHFCASKGAASAVRILIAKGARVNALNASGATALHMACRSPSLLLQEGGVKRTKETIRALLAAGASARVADARRNTPLHFAARNPYLDAEDLWLLVRAGAKLDALDMMGRTPLAAAKAFGTDRLPGRLAVLSSSAPDQPK